MEMLHKLETTIASWYKGLPHLPENGRKWLADNVWWIVLVGVILGLLAVIPALSVLLFGGAVITATYGSAYYGGLFVWALIALLVLVADLVLSGLAIAPLKSHKKMGWSLLFLVMLLNVVSTILTLVANQSFGGFLSGLIGAAIGGYFLFEIRDHFSAVAVKNTQPPVAPTTTETKKS